MYEEESESSSQHIPSKPAEAKASAAEPRPASGSQGGEAAKPRPVVALKEPPRKYGWWSFPEDQGRAI